MIVISEESATALNLAVREAGVRFLGLDKNALVFQVQRPSSSISAKLTEIAATAMGLLRDSRIPLVRALLEEAAANGVHFTFY